MDPYLESPEIWPDFHDRLAGQISITLNEALPVPYYARLEMRPEVGIVEDEGLRRRIVPDVAVVRHAHRPVQETSTAVLDGPRTEVSKSFQVKLFAEPIRHHFVEIRDPTHGHKLITLIEIVSPSNKRPGPDRDAYLRKQREVLESDASLIELDWLRTGERLISNVSVAQFLGSLEPPPDYVVLLSRAWQRGEGGLGPLVFPIGLREMLPCIPIPLRQEETEVPLDLQFVFNRAYEGGPYRRGAVNYALPPHPPLREADAAWMEQLLHSAAGSSS